MNERVDIVIIDGFADGFWPERWNAEGWAIDRKHEGRIRGAEDIGVREVMASIESLRKELGSIVCLTLQGLWVCSVLTARSGKLIDSPQGDCITLTYPHPTLLLLDGTRTIHHERGL